MRNRFAVQLFYDWYAIENSAPTGLCLEGE